MKIRFYSDLHTEFGKFRIPTEGVQDTVLVLAGDIGVGLSAMNMVERVLDKYKAVIYIAGNHEFYNQNIFDTQDRFKERTKELENFYFLENDSVKIGDTTFLGATLWTRMDAAEIALAEYYMNDYKCIYTTNRYEYSNPRGLRTRLTGKDTVRFHLNSMKWLTDNLPKDGKAVIVTHHTPTIHALNTERYKGSVLNSAYYTDLHDWIKEHRPDMWICGHTHKQLDVKVHDTRVLSNPRGYVGHDINPEFNSNIIVEL